MTVSYIVEQGLSVGGPWVAVAGSPFLTLTDTVTGLSSGASYFFRLTAQDTILGLSSTPTIVGPITTTPTLTESTQGTILTTTTGVIVDVSHATWALTTGITGVSNLTSSAQSTTSVTLTWNSASQPLRVLHPDTSVDGSNVVELLYWNHQVYRSDSTGWAFWNGIGWTSVPGDPSITLVESAQNTTVTDTVGVIVDAPLTTWRISTGQQVVHGGQSDPNTSFVVLLLYWNHTVYQENSSGGWWSWNGAAWVLTNDPRIAILTESPQGTTLNSTTGVIVDAVLDRWTLVASVSTPPFVIAHNGDSTTVSTSFVVLLLYWNHTVYQENSGNVWYRWIAGAWSQVNGDPRATAVTWSTTDKNPNITLSNANLTATTADAVQLQSIRSTVGYSTGKRFVELSLGTPVGSQPSWAGDGHVGIVNAVASLAPPSDPAFTADPNGLYLYPAFADGLFLNAVVISAYPHQGGDGTGTIFSFAVDFDAKKFWFTSTAMRAAGWAWNWDLATVQNPSTNLGGVNFSAIAPGPYFVEFGAFWAYPVTANFGGTTFNQPVPTNFLAWGAGA